MEKDEELQKELNELVPGFPEKPSALPPPGYFDQLPDRVIARWQEQSAREHIPFPGWRRMITAAAVVTGICLGTVWWSNQTEAATLDATISSADAYQYILENMEEFAPLILQEEQWSDIQIELPESAVIEQYLIEEMEVEEIENLF